MEVKFEAVWQPSCASKLPTLLCAGQILLQCPDLFQGSDATASIGHRYLQTDVASMRDNS